MAYIITKDHIGKGEAEGTMGPQGIDQDDINRLKSNIVHNDCEHFKMYDDDGELYYEGYWFAHDGEESDELEALDCFGMPNAGCTYIKMKNKSGKYEVV